VGVNRSTIPRYLPDLDRFAAYETSDGRLAIDRDHYLNHVRLTLHEATALHLAARLMTTRTDKHNPHAASALRKLGLALDRLAPTISRHLVASADVMDDPTRRRDPVYLHVLESLTRAWSDGRVAHVWHQMPDGRSFDYHFAPYFIEPYGIGRTAHVIGWREPPGALRTFKLERIRQVELTGEHYQIPADFDPRETLADAWSIWYTEAEPVEVVLRFSPRVAGRVRETQWHRSESVQDQPDGGLVWRARVAEPQEMVPWVRGWGADVEVVGPEGLRAQVAGEARRMAAMYAAVDELPTARYQLLWAKADRETGRTHPLICHMLDVALVAEALWYSVLTTSVRAQFEHFLGIAGDDAAHLIAFWAGLHDLGKASPAFQRRYQPAENALSQAGLAFPRVFVQKPFSHGAATASILTPLLTAEFGVPRRLARRVACAVGGHHGAWPTPLELQTMSASRLGGAEWEAERLQLARVLAACLSAPTVMAVPADCEETNAFLTLLSGLTSVADWIGSMVEYFPCVEPPLDPSRYLGIARLAAARALDALNWTGWTAPDKPAHFTKLFAVSGPRAVQAEAIKLAEELAHPCLVIIEAPTGVGKTEAALYLADHWARTLRQRGLYVAMPTMATSNQMFGRVTAVFNRRFPHTSIAPLLVHSQARWSRELAPPQMAIEEDGCDRPDGRTEAMAWFLPRKRSLLAPVGIGTIDQALLGVLQTRHFFVRLFGLSHKTVIFDEVHAYDTYMSALFQRLLEWLRAIGSSVVILSATLPEKTRCELVQAYAGTTECPPGSYPAITWAMDGHVGVVPIASHGSRSLAIEWLDREPTSVVAALQRALREGGCAAVVCNTVGRAQEVYQSLRASGIVPLADVFLFHARFPLAWREATERQVLARFGKGGAGPRRGVVVATQVVEQSLDLDFDVMVTDLAPVDLVIQRAGRLHRHARPNRPGPVGVPRLLIARPGSDSGIPDFGSDAYVYERYVLLRSLLALDGREQLVLPRDTVALIESVYGDEAYELEDLGPALLDALAEARQTMEARQAKADYVAHTKMIAGPDADNLLRKSNQGLAEDSPEMHEAFQALTRLGPPSISLVCLHQVEASVALEPDGTGPIVDLARPPNADLTELLVRASVAVSHLGVVPQLREQDPPIGWRRHPLLRRYRAVVFTDGHCSVAGSRFALHLTRELGLIIERRDQPHGGDT